MEQIIWAYGVVEPDGDVSALGVRDELRKFNRKQPVTVRINSPGGSVFEAVSIRQQLAEWPGGCNCQVDGLAASAASFIATAGQSVAIVSSGQIMIHDAWTIAIGNSEDMRSASEVLDQISDSLVGAYAAKSGKSRAEVRSAMRKETWYTARGSVDFGLADLIIGEDGKAEAMGGRQATRSIAAMQRQLDSLRLAAGV